MSNVQIWNGSTWINFYTLPNATSSTLGGVKIGNNITVSSGTISLTKSNVTSALGYTPLSLSGGTMTGNISYKGTKATYSMIKWIDNTADTYGNGIRIGGGGATIIGGGESAELPSVNGGEEILYLMNDGNIDFYSNCQGGLDSAKHMSFDTSGNLNVPYVKASGNIYEGGTALSSKYQAKGSYAAANHNHNSSYLPLSGGTIDGLLTITPKTDGTPLSLYYNNESDYFLKIYPDPNDYTNIYTIDVNDSASGEVALHLPSKSGTFALTSDIPNALKNPNPLKFGSKTYDGSSAQTITLSDLGGGGGMTCTRVFEGAGERQGSYWLNGKTTTISANNYKMLLFEINVNDVNFYLSVPTNFIVSGSTYFYLAAGNTNNGAMGIVQVMANNTGFKVSVSNGNITVWNVNVYAYK